MTIVEALKRACDQLAIAAIRHREMATAIYDPKITPMIHKAIAKEHEVVADRCRAAFEPPGQCERCQWQDHCLHVVPCRLEELGLPTTEPTAPAPSIIEELVSIDASPEMGSDELDSGRRW